MPTSFKLRGGSLCVILSFLYFVDSDDNTDGGWEKCDVDGVSGACMPLDACAQYVTLLRTQASTLEGLRVTRARQCGFHGQNIKVCCPTKEPLISTPEPTVSSPNEDGDDDFIDAFPKPDECGRTRSVVVANGIPVPAFPPFSGYGPSIQAEHTGTPDNTTTPKVPSTLPPLPPPLPASDERPADYFSDYKPIVRIDGVKNNTDNLQLPLSEPPPEPPVANGIPVHSRDSSRYPDMGTVPFAIYGGQRVQYREMALWMALLGYQNSAVFWKCGGSIISSRHVLTAAHCIKPNLYIVRVGELNLASEHREYYPIDFLVKRTIVHEEYTKFHNDIGVVVLRESIDFKNNLHIAPVCLPTSPEDQVVSKLLRSTTGLITGWGETEKAGERPSHLLYAYVKILGNDHCAETYKNENVTIDARVLCAGDSEMATDACNGDSGGPLVNDLVVTDQHGFQRKFYHQLGIVSYGFRCSARRHSGVYTNLTHFMPWLEEKVLGKPALWATEI